MRKLLIALLLFSFTSSAHSAYLWKSNHRSIFQATALEACTFGNITTTDIIFDSPTQVRCIGIRDGSTINGQYGSATASLRPETCPHPYIEDSQGFCVDATSCPPSGDLNYGWSSDFEAGSTTITRDGCAYTASNEFCILTDGLVDYCVYDLESTGHTSSATQTILTSVGPNEPPSDDDITNTSNITNSQTDPVTSPDGTTTQTTTTTTTDTVGAGTTVDNSNGQISATESSGTSTSTTEVKTTMDKPDGTTTEVIDTDTSVTTPSTTTYNYDYSSGSPSTTTNNSSTTISNSTTIINEYGSNGDLVSSNSTSTGNQTAGQGTGTGEGEGECNPLIENCGGSADFSGQSKDGLYTKTEMTYSSVLNDFNTQMLATPIFTQAEGFFDVSFSGTCPVYTMPAVWVFQAVTIDYFCGDVMASIWPIVSAVLQLIASFVSFRWAFL